MQATDKQEKRVKRAHIALMKHPQTALYSGVMLMGKSEVVDENFTAYTDGVNKRYSRSFLEEVVKDDAQLRGLILHENLHIAMKQVVHGKSMFKENPKLANVAADFVVNDVIHNIDGSVTGSNERIVALPDGALYDDMFHNWSMREVFNYLKKEQEKQKPESGQGDGNDDGDSDPRGSESKSKGGKTGKVMVNGKSYDLDNTDEHDFDASDLSPEEQKELADKIDRALREGGMLAGRLGAKIPRSIADLLQPKVDWREELREFVQSSVKGSDELTWRSFNRRHVANDIYLPSPVNESVGEVIVAIDTSGSIGGPELTAFASELASICSLCQPEVVRVLWWDTKVHGIQLFKDNYENIASMLKPEGGGGTRVSCVSELINEEKLNAECVIVLTDGYVESNVAWNINHPTLWMVTQSRSFTPPVGKKVKLDIE